MAWAEGGFRRRLNVALSLSLLACGSCSGSPAATSNDASVSSSDAGGDTAASEMDSPEAGPGDDASGPALDAGEVESGDAMAADAASGQVGTLGQPCAPPGRLACAGNFQKLQLLCDATGHFVSNGTCAGNQFCDTAPGPNAGSCQDAISQCVGQAPGYKFCDDGGLETCGPDTVTMLTTACTSPTPSCSDGGCTGCTVGASRCSVQYSGVYVEEIVQYCNNGSWAYSTTCNPDVTGAGGCQSWHCDGGPPRACCYTSSGNSANCRCN